MRALVLAGGQGTRLRPLTLTRPKPLVPVLAAPFAAGLLRRLRAAGGQRATFLVGADAAAFEPLVALGSQLGVEVDLVSEEAPLGTAGAARRALLRDQGRDPVVVLNGDILTDLDLAALVAAHRDRDAQVTLALTRVADTRAYGVVVTDPDGAVRRFVEKPAPGTVDADTINAGTYVLAPGVFAGFEGDGSLSFEREVFPALVERGARVHAVTGDGYWADLGTPARLREGHRAILEGRCAWPVPDGVDVVGGVARHATARVADGAVLVPPVTLGAGSVVDAGAVLSDVVMLPGARIGAGARLEGAIIGERAEIGCGARLRGDVVVGDSWQVPPGAALEGCVRVPGSPSL